MLSNMCILKEDNNDYDLFYTQKLLGSSTNALHIFACFKLHFDQGGECFHNCCLEDEETETLREYFLSKVTQLKVVKPKFELRQSHSRTQGVKGFAM